MRSCGLLLHMSYVAWSICLSVTHTDVPCKNGWTDGNAVWGWLGWAQETMYSMGSRSSTRRGNSRSCSSQWKALGVSAVVYAAKGINQSSITAWQPTAMFPIDRGHITLFPVKNSPLRCGLSSTFCDHLLCIITPYNVISVDVNHIKETKGQIIRGIAQ